MSKTTKKKNKSKHIDNLAINGSFDDVIGVSVGQPSIKKIQEKQNATPTKNKKK